MDSKMVSPVASSSPLGQSSPSDWSPSICASTPQPKICYTQKLFKAGRSFYRMYDMLSAKRCLFPRERPEFSEDEEQDNFYKNGNESEHYWNNSNSQTNDAWEYWIPKKNEEFIYMSEDAQHCPEYTNLLTEQQQPIVPESSDFEYLEQLQQMNYTEDYDETPKKIDYNHLLLQQMNDSEQYETPKKIEYRSQVDDSDENMQIVY